MGPFDLPGFRAGKSKRTEKKRHIATPVHHTIVHDESLNLRRGRDLFGSGRENTSSGRVVPSLGSSDWVSDRERDSVVVAEVVVPATIYVEASTVVRAWLKILESQEKNVRREKVTETWELVLVTPSIEQTGRHDEMRLGAFDPRPGRDADMDPPLRLYSSDQYHQPRQRLFVTPYSHGYLADVPIVGQAQAEVVVLVVLG
ncbi:hypothetical protein EDC04DRAFT_3138538 [Pisolithus marmoratus]|nr:hypothetical protein EDC04DRAFT_3138538 [Pisolithus marmoratus]